MKKYTKESVNELLIQKYKLDLIDDEERRKLCQERLKLFLDDIYDLSRDEVGVLTKNQTFVFRKKYGVLDNGFAKSQHEISNEIGITTQAVSLRLQKIMDRALPHMIYVGESNKTLEIDKILSIPLEEVGFPAKAYACLKKAGVANLGDIMHLTREEITEIYSLSAKGRQQLEQTVHSYGLKFADEVQQDRAASMLKRIEESSSKEDKISQDFLETPICFMGFSARAYNCLKRSNITNLKELINLTTIDLLKIPSLGSMVLTEIRSKVFSYGLRFLDEEKIEVVDSLLGSNDDKTELVNELLESPIEVMRLSPRTYNALKNSGIQTMQDIVNILPAIKLGEIRGLGTKGIEELYRKIDTYKSYLKTSFVKYNSQSQDESLSEELIQRRNNLIHRYNNLSNEKELLLLREREIKSEMRDILLELNYSEKGDKNEGKAKSIGGITSTRRNSR